MIKVGILGATGYAGIELVRILCRHPEVEITSIVSQSFVGKKISDVYPNLRGIVDTVCEELDAKEISTKCDVVFTALPHGASKTVIPELVQYGLKVIDLSGDFRYNDVSVYEKWYGTKHENAQLLESAVYGMPELHRDKIANADLIGNPGCYTTCSILGLIPLLANKLVDTKNIIIDAKSAVSGAGRSLGLDYHFCECTENMKAYKIATHRHTSEIEQELGIAAQEEIMVSFTPHLIPMKRGIISTMYANLKNKHTTAQLLDIYQRYYKDEFFIRIYDEGQLPETNHVAGSNFIDIGLVVDERLNRVIVVSALDNLIKGAAGQAVQNMNIMFKLDEKTGLATPGLYL
ncbi:N-acetyl-gamma-glutamyl-phosphate reductase [Petroclostridium sp. X23]|uniref:N-acetyl-gamma-glutamyl-phosphate reductase n=1 Tax=Petroclostridium sp. X23 TaxID=3045146 RepID=UPI0024AD8B88|nr:N-acetyl-gamma-glutamyl-phosphate reductase [Petroclostridium sp. X23]WHH58419.1 N-acetyl-gamma-glutamyl-phosphate reductase [Petroclostridium sp. X23]